MLRKLQEIRSADRSTRITWVVVLSTISTAIVILVWIFSLRILTAKIASPDFAQRDSGPAKSIGRNIKDAFSELRTRTANTIDYFSALINENNTVLQSSSTTESSTQNQ